MSKEKRAKKEVSLFSSEKLPYFGKEFL